jgi:hypothetical protein
MDQSIGQIELDGLYQVRVEVRVTTSCRVLAWCIGCQCKDRGLLNIVAGPELLAHLPSIRLGCVNSQKYHMRPKQGRNVDCVNTTVNSADEVSSTRKKTRKECTILRIVVRYQYPSREPTQVAGLVT